MRTKLVLSNAAETVAMSYFVALAGMMYLGLASIPMTRLCLNMMLRAPVLQVARVVSVAMKFINVMIDRMSIMPVFRLICLI